jgi:hypothetical protein
MRYQRSSSRIKSAIVSTTNGHPTSTTGYEAIYEVLKVVSGKSQGAPEPCCAVATDAVGREEERILWRWILEHADRRDLAPRDCHHPEVEAVVSVLD